MSTTTPSPAEEAAAGTVTVDDDDVVEVHPDQATPDGQPAAGKSMELAPRTRTREVIQPLDVGQQKAAMATYQQGLREILDDSDYQGNGSDRFVKKSGWRKIAAWFDLDVQIVTEHVERDEHGSPIRAHVVARAIAPSGRSMDGDGRCSIDESRFSRSGGRQKLENDLPATATTRAKNRAIADLVGMGAVSAEEVDASGGHDLPPFGPAFPDDRKRNLLHATAYLIGGPDHPEDDVKAAKDVLGRVTRDCGYMPAAVAGTLLAVAGVVADRADTVNVRPDVKDAAGDSADPSPAS